MAGISVAPFFVQKGERNMRKTFGGALFALALVFGIIATTSPTVDAQWRTRDNGYNNQQVQQGFQYGVNTGAADAQRRQSYSPQRSRYYRDAPTQAFREGFTRGYDQGYRQYAGAYGNGNGGYRNDGAYGNGGYRNGGYDNQQINAGYQQGLNTGASDGRSNKGYSPERSRYYQNASTQAFREGFVRGYDEGYRQYSGNRSNGRSNTAASILEQIFRRP
jgi:flagellar biosynthesis/type III secretory pathway protein FliH